MIRTERIKALLVDDEAHALGNLQELLAMYCHGIQVCDTASSAMEAVEKIALHHPEVLFLDVNMPGKNGFELLEMLTDIPLLVFVTAHDSFAIQAMRVCAIDYLLKPIDIRELQRVEKTLKGMLGMGRAHRDLYPLMVKNLNNMLNTKRVSPRITLPLSSGYEITELSDILYVRGMDNYSSFMLKDNRQLMVAKTLKEYEELLLPFGFMRIHKSILANLSRASEIIRSESHQLRMHNGELLPVSRRKLPELLNAFKPGSYET